MKQLGHLATVIVIVLSATTGAGAADGDLRIRTRSEGLVAGDIQVEADLGPDGYPARLFLDGAAVCTLTSEEPECSVDLGKDLHLHLLELIRTEAGGGTVRVERWLNRPGHEADLEIQLAARPIGDQCGGRLRWLDPAAHNPIALAVEASGESWPVSSSDRMFAYRCADDGETEVVSASAVFAGGRRAATSVVTDDSGRATGETLNPVAFSAASAVDDPCETLGPLLETGTRVDRYQGVDVAFVLDPGANYGALAGLSAPSASGGGSWQEIAATFSEADGLWFVTPDERLVREDGFSQGRDGWFGRFFELGPRKPIDRVQIADAVATAGLTAGAGAHRRAVVLLLGQAVDTDPGPITPAGARAYLAEIGVPLFVIRTGERGADGWPAGVQVNSITDLAAALDDISEDLDRQCVAWVPADQRPEMTAALLPADLVIAGRDAIAPDAILTVWQRAAISASSSGDRPVTDQPVASDQVEVTAVSVLVRTRDENRRPVTDLSPVDLAVTEDGRSVPVLAVEPLPQLRLKPGESRAPTAAASTDALPKRKIVPVAVYVERRLAGTADMAPALAELAERAEWLTTLGPVDIVVADVTVEPFLESTSDPAVVRTALQELGELPSTDHAIERIRKQYVRYVREYPDRGRPTDSDGIETSTPGNILRLKTMTAARSAIFEEDALLKRTMARMNDWALGLPSMGPRLLFLVGTGFDEDPIDFYMYFLESKEPSLAAAARAEFLRYNQATRVDSVGRELAAAGWMVVPVATRVAGSMRTAAEFGGGEKFQAFLTDSTAEGGYLRDIEFMLLDPLGSQQHLAEPSGGKVVVGGRGLDKLISESSGWYRVTYQVDRAPDGALHEVAFTSNRPGVEIESTGVVVSGTSEGRAAMRLRTLLGDPTLDGELPVRVEIGEPKSAEDGHVTADVIVNVDFAPIAPLFAEDGKRVLRFSVAVSGDSGGPSIHHQLATAVGALGGMRYEIPIRWKKENPSEVAVVVEDLSSSAWGGTVRELRD